MMFQDRPPRTVFGRTRSRTVTHTPGWSVALSAEKRQQNTDKRHRDERRRRAERREEERVDVNASRWRERGGRSSCGRRVTEEVLRGQHQLALHDGERRAQLG